MLPTKLLMSRLQGEQVVPKRLALSAKNTQMAEDIIALFLQCVGKRQADLDESLQVLEGETTDYRVKRGLAHLLKNGFSTFETISPLEPEDLRRRMFALAAKEVPTVEKAERLALEFSARLSEELSKEVSLSEVKKGLYADLKENAILTNFDSPEPDTLIHRYNLSQVQGVLYRAKHIDITAYRNIPGEYKQLFRYLKLFGLMSYIEGDEDHGFSVKIDGPTSLFGVSTRYGTDLAKFLPALLHVSKWTMEADLVLKQAYDASKREAKLSLDADCGLVSHYKKAKAYDSMLEEAFAKRWEKTKTPWRLEREVHLLPLPGSVMIPDFRLVHPDGRDYIFEIVGYWRPEYLRKKFSQISRAGQDNIILAISQRLNLEKAGIKLDNVRAKIVWFKQKILPKDVLNLIEA